MLVRVFVICGPFNISHDFNDFKSRDSVKLRNGTHYIRTFSNKKNYKNEEIHYI